MNKFTKSMLATTLALSMSSQYATAETRQVGAVVWDTEAATQIDTDNVPDNMSQLVFIRFADNLPTTTNANVSIDEDYQISLQSGHLSKVMVCTGEHKLSAQSTARKSNALLFEPQDAESRPSQTYYYRVQADAQGNTQITPLGINSKVNGQLLPEYVETMPMQTHQISRVTADCPVAAPIPMPVTVIMPAPIVIKAQPKPAPVVPKPQPEPIEFNKPVELDVLFEFDSAVVVPQYYARINDMAQFINDNDASAIIEGHTDSIGDNTYNMQLSQQRADAVKQLLVAEYGVNPAKLTTQGFGETRPIAPNDTDAGRQQNRRVLAIALR